MKQLREGVWQIECSGVNAYLADDDGTLTLIDAGTPRDEQTIRAAVAEAGYALTDIERVLKRHRMSAFDPYRFDLDMIEEVIEVLVGTDAPGQQPDQDYGRGISGLFKRLFGGREKR